MNKKSSLVKMMTWYQIGDETLLNLRWPCCLIDGLTWPGDAIWRHRSGSTLAQVMVGAWRHQAITWTNVDLPSVRSNENHLRAISQEISQSSITKISLKITCLNFMRANESILTGWEFQYFVMFVRTEAENLLDTPKGLFLWHELTLIPVWLSSYKPGSAWAKTLIHSQTSMAANGWVIKSQTLLGMWLLIHVGIRELIHVSKKAAGRKLTLPQDANANIYNTPISTIIIRD